MLELRVARCLAVLGAGCALGCAADRPLQGFERADAAPAESPNDPGANDPSADDPRADDTGAREAGVAANAEAAAEPAEAGSALDAGAREQRLELSLEREELLIDLNAPAVVSAERRGSTDWDLAITGWVVQTNSGPSGPGDGAAFGPSDPFDFLFDTLPAVPLRPDKASGPLSTWYVYADATVSSRQHVYVLRSGGVHYKLQVLSYYGERAGERTSALYQLRYAPLSADGTGALVEVSDLDASAGGATTSAESSAACLDLESGERSFLTPAQQQTETAWHLCFRRNDAFTNGGLSGPGGVEAVDLDAERSDSDLMGLSAAAQLERFLAVDHAAASSPTLTYRSDDQVDAVIAANWVSAADTSAEIVDASWIVRSGDGSDHYALLFEDLRDPSPAGPSAVRLRIKALRP